MSHRLVAFGLTCGVLALPACAGAPLAQPTPGVQFVRGMILHHEQALVMTALAAARSADARVGLLAERIDATQREEIALMRRWLSGQGASDLRGHEHGHAHMPGMLTPAELERLAAARGTAFDRLFLDSMIRHHEGALTMVAELSSAGGGPQDPLLFRLASDIDADQRAEIARMRSLLSTL